MGLCDEAIAYLTTASPTEVIYLTQESAKKYGIAYENALPTEADIQLLLQRLLKPSPPQSQSSPIVTTVTDNLMLRRYPDPLSPSVLEGLYPDHTPCRSSLQLRELFPGFSSLHENTQRKNLVPTDLQRR